LCSHWFPPKVLCTAHQEFVSNSYILLARFWRHIPVKMAPMLIHKLWNVFTPHFLPLRWSINHWWMPHYPILRLSVKLAIFGVCTVFKPEISCDIIGSVEWRRHFEQS